MIGRAQRFDVSQDHCGRVVSNGDFDLRNGLARLEIRDHRGERRQFVGERLLQYTARFQSCDAVAEALAESDQQLAGIAHGANGQTRAPPVVVQRTAHRRECRLRDRHRLLRVDRAAIAASARADPSAVRCCMLQPPQRMNASHAGFACAPTVTNHCSGSAYQSPWRRRTTRALTTSPGNAPFTCTG